MCRVYVDCMKGSVMGTDVDHRTAVPIMLASVSIVDKESLREFNMSIIIIIVIIIIISSSSSNMNDSSSNTKGWNTPS